MHQLAIITGGSRGIGLSSAKLFTEQGWDVISIARTPCPLNQVISLISDLTQANFLNELQPKLEPYLVGKPRVALVHNAGLTTFDSAIAHDRTELTRLLEVNIFSPLALNSLIVPLMGADSSIIYIGSMLSSESVPGSASYTIAKHAMVGAMRATCQDLWSHPHIHTCCICPRNVETDMLNEVFKDHAMLEEQKQRVSRQRLIKPEELADLIYHCSQTPIINGSVIDAHMGTLAFRPS